MLPISKTSDNLNSMTMSHHRPASSSGTKRNMWHYHLTADININYQFCDSRLPITPLPPPKLLHFQSSLPLTLFCNCIRSDKGEIDVQNVCSRRKVISPHLQVIEF